MTVPAPTINKRDFVANMRLQELFAIMCPHLTRQLNWSVAIPPKRVMCCLMEDQFGRYQEFQFLQPHFKKKFLTVTTTGMLRMPELSAECWVTTQEIRWQQEDLLSATFQITLYWMMFNAMGMKQTFGCVPTR